MNKDTLGTILLNERTPFNGPYTKSKENYLNYECFLICIMNEETVEDLYFGIFSLSLLKCKYGILSYKASEIHIEEILLSSRGLHF